MANKSNIKGFFTLPLIYKFYADHRQMTKELIEKHGRNFGLRGLFNNIHFFTEPKFIGRVFYENNNNYPRALNPYFDGISDPSGKLDEKAILRIREQWKKMRPDVLNQLFTPSYVKKYVDTVVSETSRHLEKWIDTYKGGQTLFPYQLINYLAAQNIRKAHLGNVDLDMDDLVNTIGELVDLEIQYELSVTKLAWKLPTPTRRRTKAVVKKLIKLHEIIVKHCLSEEVTDVVVFKNIVKRYKEEYKVISDVQNLPTFLSGVAAIYTIAGFDSMSHALPVTFALLSQHPEVAKKIREEVNTVIGEGKISLDNIDSLVYTRATFLESLRITGGIFPLLIRKAIADDNIDGYIVKKGDRIIVPVYYMAHLPEFWENPEVFDPSRFLNIDPMDERYRYAYLPFGAGVSGCLGRHFAVLQVTIILAMAMQKFRLELLPGQTINPDHPQNIALKMILDGEQIKSEEHAHLAT